MSILISVIRQIPLEQATDADKVYAATQTRNLEVCEALAKCEALEIRRAILRNEQIPFYKKYYWLNHCLEKEIKDNLWRLAISEVTQNRSTNAVCVFLRSVFEGPYNVKNQELIDALFTSWYFFSKLTKYDSDCWHTMMAEKYIRENIFGTSKENMNWCFETIFCVANMFLEDKEKAEIFEDTLKYNVRGRFISYIELFKKYTKFIYHKDVSLYQWYILLGKIFYLVEEEKITDRNELLKVIKANNEVDERFFDQAYECFKQCY